MDLDQILRYRNQDLGSNPLTKFNFHREYATLSSFCFEICFCSIVLQNDFSAFCTFIHDIMSIPQLITRMGTCVLQVLQNLTVIPIGPSPPPSGNTPMESLLEIQNEQSTNTFEYIPNVNIISREYLESLDDASSSRNHFSWVQLGDFMTHPWRSSELALQNITNDYENVMSRPTSKDACLDIAINCYSIALQYEFIDCSRRNSEEDETFWKMYGDECDIFRLKKAFYGRSWCFQQLGYCDRALNDCTRAKCLWFQLATLMEENCSTPEKVPHLRVDILFLLAELQAQAQEFQHAIDQMDEVLGLGSKKRTLSQWKRAKVLKARYALALLNQYKARGSIKQRQLEKPQPEDFSLNSGRRGQMHHASASSVDTHYHHHLGTFHFMSQVLLCLSIFLERSSGQSIDRAHKDDISRDI